MKSRKGKDMINALPAIYAAIQAVKQFQSNQKANYNNSAQSVSTAGNRIFR